MGVNKHFIYDDDINTHGIDNVVMYHSGCQDGFTAAWVAYECFGKEAVYIEAPQDPNLNVKIRGHFEDKNLYVLDLGMKKKRIEKLSDTVSQLVLIDHHETNEQYFKEAKNEGLADEVIFDLEKSGAMLAWEYFDPEIGRAIKGTPPDLIRYVQDRDLWNHDLDYTEEINLALRSIDKTFEKWNDLACRHDFIKHTRSIGSKIREYRDQQIKRILWHARTRRITNQAFEDTLPGEPERPYKVGVVNSPILQSDVAEAMKDKADMVVVWYRKSDGRIKASLRASEDNNIHVGEFAEKAYGGGGHENAGGFKCHQSEFDSLMDRWEMYQSQKSPYLR